jgi:hypothetical protein
MCIRTVRKTVKKAEGPTVRISAPAPHGQKKKGNAAGKKRHLHSQPLHLSATQRRRIGGTHAPYTPDMAVIDLAPKKRCSALGEGGIVVVDGSVEVRVEPFGELVDEVFGTSETGCFSYLVFIWAEVGVAKRYVFFDLRGRGG